MSERKFVRGIGEKKEVVEVSYDAEIVEDTESLYLVVGGTEIAFTSEAGNKYVVSVFAGVNDFYVTSEVEAIDALADIGRFYLAVKAGEV